MQALKQVRSVSGYRNCPLAAVMDLLDPMLALDLAVATDHVVADPLLAGLTLGMGQVMLTHGLPVLRRATRPPRHRALSAQHRGDKEHSQRSPGKHGDRV